jgi:hypothetical protein
LRRLIEVVCHFEHGATRVDDPQEDDCVHLQRDVVASDDVLRWDFECFLAQRDANNSVHRGEDNDHARPFRFRKRPAQAKDDAAFVFPQDLDRAQDVNDDDDDADADYSAE